MIRAVVIADGEVVAQEFPLDKECLKWFRLGITTRDRYHDASSIEVYTDVECSWLEDSVITSDRELAKKIRECLEE